MLGLPAFNITNFIKSTFSQSGQSQESATNRAPLSGLRPPVYTAAQSDHFHPTNQDPPKYLPHYSEHKLDSMMDAGPSQHPGFLAWAQWKFKQWESERKIMKTGKNFDAWLESNYYKREAKERERLRTMRLQATLNQLRAQHRREAREFNAGTRTQYSDEVDAYRRYILLHHDRSPEEELEDEFHFPFDALG